LKKALILIALMAGVFAWGHESENIDPEKILETYSSQEALVGLATFAQIANAHLTEGITLLNSGLIEEIYTTSEMNIDPNQGPFTEMSDEEFEAALAAHPVRGRIADEKWPPFKEQIAASHRVWKSGKRKSKVGATLTEFRQDNIPIKEAVSDFVARYLEATNCFSGNPQVVQRFFDSEASATNLEERAYQLVRDSYEKNCQK
jgi:hypothetical protein